MQKTTMNYPTVAVPRPSQIVVKSRFAFPRGRYPGAAGDAGRPGDAPRRHHGGPGGAPGAMRQRLHPGTMRPTTPPRYPPRSNGATIWNGRCAGWPP